MKRSKWTFDYVLTVSGYVVLFMLMYAVHLGCSQIGWWWVNPTLNNEPFANFGIFAYFGLFFNMACFLIIPYFATEYLSRKEEKLYNDFRYLPEDKQINRSVPKTAMIVEIILIVALSVAALSTHCFHDRYDVVENSEIGSFVLCPLTMIVASVIIYRETDEYFYKEDCRIWREEQDRKYKEEEERKKKMYGY